jgi:hypothetical protein
MICPGFLLIAELHHCYIFIRVLLLLVSPDCFLPGIVWYGLAPLADLANQTRSFDWFFCFDGFEWLADGVGKD